MKTIYLTGFMGTGKSTIGKLLSRKLNLDFVDTDQLIMDKVGKSISSIFQDEGEEVFRKYEYEELRSLPVNNIVVSTGGGIILDKKNRIYMRNNGFVINLDCDFTVIVERIQNSNLSKDTRPLFQNDIQNLEQRYLSRKMLYQDSDIIINTNQSIDEITDLVIEWISEERE